MDEDTSAGNASTNDDPSTIEQSKVQVDLHADLSEGGRQGMALLLQSLSPIWVHYPVPYLERVVVVPHSDIPKMVNAIVRIIEGREINYTSSPVHPATGVAVPCADEGLHCFIVLAAEIFVDLTAERFRPVEAVSTILEEFLHVWLYGEAWRRRGYLYLTNPDEPCEQDLLMKLAQAFDEYLVMRHKIAIVGTLALIDGENGPISGQLAYAGNVRQLVAEGERTIRQAIYDVAGGRKSVEEVWPAFCDHLYRGMLEPLSRNAAVGDTYSETSLLQDLPDTELFKKVTGSYWQALHTQLKRSYDAPEETEDALRTAMAELRKYLKSIGVTYRKTHDGTGYVLFDNSFFLEFSRFHSM